jgi:Tfp pilus assembly protein PilX
MINRINPRDEDGIALVAGILILFIVFMLGLAIMQTVDVQTRSSGREVAGEAAFNLAESALNAEAYQLEQSWPDSRGTLLYPTSCTQGTTASTGCPGSSLTSALSSTYAGVDFGSATWTVKVLDDTSSGAATSGDYKSYYSDTALNTSSPITYDKDGDNRLWVRAQGTVLGQTRIVVGQVVRATQTLALPQNTVTAGGVYTSNNGNKVIIEAKDPNSGITGPVNVRCSASAPQYGTTCEGWDANHGQLDPSGSYSSGYVDPNGGFASLSAAALASLKATAISNNKYYNGLASTNNTCPTNLTGLIYVDNLNCSYNASGTWNSDASPGALIFGTGTLELNGNINYYGIIYMANQQETTFPATGSPCTSTYSGTTPVMTVHGGGSIHGAVFIDGCGLLNAGDEKFDIVFDTSAFGGFKAYATPAAAKNTFRILSNNGS